MPPLTGCLSMMPGMTADIIELPTGILALNIKLTNSFDSDTIAYNINIHKLPYPSIKSLNVPGYSSGPKIKATVNYIR